MKCDRCIYFGIWKLPADPNISTIVEKKWIWWYNILQVSWIRKGDVVVLTHGTAVFTSDERVTVSNSLSSVGGVHSIAWLSWCLLRNEGHKGSEVEVVLASGWPGFTYHTRRRFWLNKSHEKFKKNVLVQIVVEKKCSQNFRNFPSKWKTTK